LKYKSLLILTLSTLLLLSGCKDKKTVSTPSDNTGSKTTESSSSKTPDSPPKGSDNPVEQKYYSPYTGEEVTKEALSNVAFMTIVENSPDAWPLSGLAEADIVYEAMTEGGVTRFLALYQKENSDKIGPVRSMRTYFLDLTYEYNLPFGHCGGSHDSLSRIKNEKSLSLDEMANGAFYWRDKTIKIQEHSLYTSTEKLRNLVQNKSYVKEPTVKLKFDKAYWDKVNSSPAANVSLKFNGAYTTAYDFKDGFYYKSMNKTQTKNKDNGKPVAVKNIVIQNVKYRTRPKEEYLDADLIGQGDGYIISNGQAIKVRWSKADLRSQTIFKDEKGNIVPLNPGKTWWHLMDQNASLSIK
jgi:hypothetical protein